MVNKDGVIGVTEVLERHGKSIFLGSRFGEQIVTIKGIKYRQSLSAPVDGIVVHPLIMEKILSDVSADEPIDTYITTVGV